MVTRHGQEEEHLQLEHGASLSQWLHSLAAQELARRLAGCTVWWRVGETGADDSVDIVRGLPDGPGFVKLLGGREASR